jgi:hypothetical protein
VSGAFSTTREKPGDKFIARQIVPITALLYQGLTIYQINLILETRRFKYVFIFPKRGNIKHI